MSGAVTRLRRCDGQAAIEVVALLPLLVAVVAAVLCVLSAGSAANAAGSAAQAGAIALIRGADAEAAARGALTGWPRRSTTIRVTGRRIEVEVRPRLPVPALASRLTGRASAHAGPVSTAPAAAATAVRGGDGISSRPPAQRGDRP